MVLCDAAGLAIAPPGFAVGLDVELLGRVPKRWVKGTYVCLLYRASSAL